MTSPNYLIDVYHEAHRVMGSSTQKEIVAEGESGFILNGLFEDAYSQSSVFYKAFRLRRPYLLKMPNVPSSAYHEYNVYSSASSNGHPGKEYLMKVDIIRLKVKQVDAFVTTSSSSSSSVLEAVNVPRTPLRHLPSNVALLMNYFHLTLSSFPSNVLGMHDQYMNALNHIMLGMDALHASGYVHCDVKPGNIFFQTTADGQFFLGDYDAAVKINQPVERTTVEYLPAEFIALREMNRLQASPSIDYAMLAFTLAGRCALPYHETDSESSSSSSSSHEMNQSPRLFFNLCRFRRTLSTLRSCTAAESQRLKALLTIHQSNPIQPELDPHPTPESDPWLFRDMQRRCDLMQEINKIVDKVEKLDSTQVSEGRLFASHRLSLVQGQPISSLTPARLSSQIYSYPF